MSKSAEEQLKALANSYKAAAAVKPTTTTGLTGSVGQGGKNVKADVTKVQTLLNKKGAKLAVDGSCGPKTIAAITAYQKQAMKMAKPDGRVDVNGATWKSLNAATAAPAPAKPATPAAAPAANTAGITASVGQGGKNIKADVIKVQNLLNKKNAKLAVDGSCGPKTIAAITAFQKQVVKLSKPDGRIDPNGTTWKALNGTSGNITTTPAPAAPKPAAPGNIISRELNSRSLKSLNGVNSNLVKVVKRAIQITPVYFIVIEGLRTKERQAQLVKQGASKTMNSRHLTGHAVDIVPSPDGGKTIDWNNKTQFKQVAAAMKQAAKECGVKITWGGDWKNFVDMPHYEITW